MSIETLRAAVQTKYITVYPDSIHFLGGYYDGSWEIEFVEGELKKHGFKRVIRYVERQVSGGFENVPAADESPKPKQDGEYRLWPNFVMQIAPIK